MTISKPMLLTLLALIMAGVGFAMYVGMHMGMSMDASRELSIEPASSTAAPQTVECRFDGSDLSQGDEGEDRGHEREERSSGGDYATNSGKVVDSQFTDGGYGDIGQQWRDVTVNGDVNNVHISGSEGAQTMIGDHTPAPTTTTSTLPPAEPIVDAGDTITTSTSSTSTTSTTLPPA